MGGLGLKSLIFFRFWIDFGGPGAEIFDFSLGFGLILEGMGLKSVIFLRFWIDFGGPGAEIFDFLQVFERFWRAWG